MFLLEFVSNFILHHIKLWVAAPISDFASYEITFDLLSSLFLRISYCLCVMHNNNHSGRLLKSQQLNLSNN